ncbi:Arm DNA-binding domain-containing protein [Photobacterium damselae]|uniref:Arm DNA-binding domain-containing protein n=1 Tax=Photobacterium damselae TaxID=38293 RepID=UPI00165EAF9A|nr:Arm DNA-binding domain-containing protein [Photobacterium damselae]
MSLTDRQLNLISKQDTYDGKAEISDGEGLVVRITPQAKIYFHYRCRFNKKSLRIRIGKYPVTSLKEARRMHKLMMELRESGRNPNIAITGELEFITLDDCVAYHNDVCFLGGDLDKPITISAAKKGITDT